MTSHIVRAMVLWCPDWPITAALREHGLAPDTPLALIDHGAVFACSPTARQEGVRRGLRVREAQSRLPEVIVQPYDTVHDNRAFEPVLAEIERIMPGVQMLRAGMCAIHGRGPARYYGSERAAALALIGMLDALGIHGARVGIADGTFTAEQAARLCGAAVAIVPEGGAAAFLAPVSVGVLDQPQLVMLLRRLGIHTLGDFAALPAMDVRDRFGEVGARLHALSSGRDSRRIVPRTPPQEFDRTIEFEPPLDRIDQVTFGFRASADRFIEGLIAAKLVCTGLRIELESDSGEVSERSWLHPRSFTAADVVDRVRWQLQGGSAGRVDQDSGLSSPITRVRVIPESVDSIGNHEEGLWGTGPDERVHHGLSRVQSLLGHGAVLTAAIGGGRTLVERQQLVAWGDRVPGAHDARPWPGHLPAPAPSTLFPAPHAVHVLAAGGEPIVVDDRGALSAAPAKFAAPGSPKPPRAITAWAGPWPVDQRWWNADAAASAHRFQVVDADGVAWLLVLERGIWWAEARYD